MGARGRRADNADAGGDVPAFCVGVDGGGLGQLAHHLEAHHIGGLQPPHGDAVGLRQGGQRRPQDHAGMASQRRSHIVVIEHMGGDAVVERRRFRRGASGAPPQRRAAAGAQRREIGQGARRGGFVLAGNAHRIGIQEGARAIMAQRRGQGFGIKCRGECPNLFRRRHADLSWCPGLRPVSGRGIFVIRSAYRPHEERRGGIYRSSP
ncbi:hypothetical protein FQZ97_816900 [compost metagenome]